MQGSVNYLWKFIDLSYTIENLIGTSGLEKYPSDFDSYFTSF